MSASSAPVWRHASGSPALLAVRALIVIALASREARLKAACLKEDPYDASVRRCLEEAIRLIDDEER